MKKIATIMLMAGLVAPAFAGTDTQALSVTDGQGAVVTSAMGNGFLADESVKNGLAVMETPSNPEIKFPRGVQFGAGVSATSGLNGFIGYNNKKFDSFWLKRLGVRFDFASTKPLKSFINKGVDKVMGDDGIEINDEISIVDGTIKAQHIGALVDVYPFGDTWFLGGWRLTGGYVFGKLDLDAKLKGEVEGVPGDPIEFEFDGVTYKYNGNDVYGTATAKWKYQGPYVGTGFDLGLFWGIKIYLDAGIVFTDRAAELDISVDTSNLAEKCIGGVCSPFDIATDLDGFNERKDAELKDAQDELDKAKFYPMVKLGIMYRF